MDCFVIDDEIGTALHICKYVERNEDLILVGYETDSEIGLQKILDGRIKADVLFLDIHMDGVNGIDFALQVKDRMQIVFVTGDTSYGHMAYDFNIADYLTKPVTYPRFLQAVEKLKNLELKKIPQVSTKLSRVALSRGKKGQLLMVEREDIVFMMSASNHVHIYFTNRDPLKLLAQLVHLEKLMIGGNFMRTHKSYLVNMNKILGVEHNTIELTNGYEAELGDSYRDEFMERLGRKG